MVDAELDKKDLLKKLGRYDVTELQGAIKRLDANRRFRSDFEITIDDLDGLVHTAASELSFELDGEALDIRVLGEVVTRYDRDIQRMMATSLADGPDEFKQAGWLTFWFRKLKPVAYPRDDAGWLRINEVIAFTIGFCIINSVNPQDIKGWGRTAKVRTEAFESFVTDFTYHLRYGPASPAMLAQTYLRSLESSADVGRRKVRGDRGEIGGVKGYPPRQPTAP